MKLIFCDIKIPITNEFQNILSQYGDIYNGHILKLKVDAVVSPANSFGFMDGGIDAAYTFTFGREIQTKLQEDIKNKYNGELLVGQAIPIETNHPTIPYIISAPTMRVPLDIRGTLNVFLATKAVLNLVNYGKFENGEPIKDKIHSIAFPGLGTGCGQLTAKTCALQMAEAIKEQKFPTSWREARDNHWKTIFLR